MIYRRAHNFMLIYHNISVSQSVCPLLNSRMSNCATKNVHTRWVAYNHQKYCLKRLCLRVMASERANMLIIMAYLRSVRCTLKHQRLLDEGVQACVLLRSELQRLQQCRLQSHLACYYAHARQSQKSKYHLPWVYRNRK